MAWSDLFSAISNLDTLYPCDIGILNNLWNISTVISYVFVRILLGVLWRFICFKHIYNLFGIKYVINFYHPRMRVGNHFTQVCVCVYVCLSVCVSVCLDYNFWTAIAWNFIFGMQIHLDHIKYQGHLVQVKVKCLKCHIFLIYYLYMLVFHQNMLKISRSSEGLGHSLSRLNDEI